MNNIAKSVYITLAEDFGMELIPYEDGDYYDFHFNLRNGIEIKKPKWNNICWILQFKTDLSYAQLVSPSLDSKKLTIDECLSQVGKLIDLAKVFDSVEA